MTVEEKIRYATAKVRNIIYYRLTVEVNCENSGDEYLSRFRCQYIHVLRQYRKSLLALVEEIPDGDTRKEFFQGMINLISPKVKSDGCKDVIKRLRDHWNKYVKQ